MNRYPTAEEVVRHWSGLPRCLMTPLSIFRDQIRKAPDKELESVRDGLARARKEALAWLDRIAAYEQALNQEIGKRS